MEALLSIVEVVQDLPIEPVIKRAPDDDKILACAAVARADWIVSGDDHLLSLKRYKGIPIVTPKQFSRVWAKKE
jgi:predicted nucleic acid-binding protein